LLKARLGNAFGAGPWIQLSEKQTRGSKFVDDEHKKFVDGIPSHSDKRNRKKPDVKEVAPKAMGEWGVIKKLRERKVEDESSSADEDSGHDDVWKEAGPPGGEPGCRVARDSIRFRC